MQDGKPGFSLQNPYHLLLLNDLAPWFCTNWTQQSNCVLKASDISLIQRYCPVALGNGSLTKRSAIQLHTNQGFDIEHSRKVWNFGSHFLFTRVTIPCTESYLIESLLSNVSLNPELLQCSTWGGSPWPTETNIDSHSSLQLLPRCFDYPHLCLSRRLVLFV